MILKQMGVLIALFISMLVLSSCDEKTTIDTDSSSSTRTVKAAFSPSAFYLPLLVVQHERLLDEYGYTLELTEIPNNAVLVSQFLTGKIDITAQNFMTMYKLQEDHPGFFKFVYGQYNRSYGFLVQRSSNIETLADIKGEKVGGWQSPTVPSYMKCILHHFGLRQFNIDEQLELINPALMQDKFIDGDVAVLLTADVYLEALQKEHSDVVKLNANLNQQLLSPGLELFGGGGFMRTAAIIEDPDKARAIRAAISEAIDIINNDRSRIYRILSQKLDLPLEVIEGAPIDKFSLPNETLVASAEATYKLMVDADVTAGGLKDLSGIFWYGYGDQR